MVSIRGFDSREVPLFIDGIPVYVPYDGYVDLGRFTTADLAAIQVAKGFSSVAYGANTLGGAISRFSPLLEMALLGQGKPVLRLQQGAGPDRGAQGQAVPRPVRQRNQQLHGWHLHHPQNRGSGECRADGTQHLQGPDQRRFRRTRIVPLRPARPALRHALQDRRAQRNRRQRRHQHHAEGHPVLVRRRRQHPARFSPDAVRRRRAAPVAAGRVFPQ